MTQNLENIKNYLVQLYCIKQKRMHFKQFIVNNKKEKIKPALTFSRNICNKFHSASCRLIINEFITKKSNFFDEFRPSLMFIMKKSGVDILMQE